MSLRPSSSRSPIACSGDMYAGVPTATPVTVSRESPAAARAMPKSVTTARPVDAVEQDVVGLHVAVHDAARVRVRQRVGDVAQDAPRVGDRQRGSRARRCARLSPSTSAMTK